MTSNNALQPDTTHHYSDERVPASGQFGQAKLRTTTPGGRYQHMRPDP